MGELRISHLPGSRYHGVYGISMPSGIPPLSTVHLIDPAFHTGVRFSVPTRSGATPTERESLA